MIDEKQATTPILLNEHDAAKVLGVTPRALQNWRQRKDGSGPPYVVISSRCLRYRVADLNQWISERVNGSASL